MPYSLPDAATPFHLNFPDEEYSQLQKLLRLSRIGPLTWENQHTAGRYGVSHQWLTSIKDYWLTKFDWRAQERYINSFPNYMIRVEDHKGAVDLHFVALLSAKKNAIPLVLLHGWPGSFLEFLPTLEFFREKYDADALPFHIIVPSLPGYTLSSGPPQDNAWVAEDAARIINTGLSMLNFDQYVVQGGDVGCLIAGILASQYSSVIGIHLNLLPSLDQVEPTDPDLTVWEKEAVESSRKRFATPTMGAAIMNSTRPATLGAVLSSSPLAYLAWIGEKHLEWPEHHLDADHILTTVTLYWLTDTLPRCVYTYRDTFLCGYVHDIPFYDKPFGYSWFKYEPTPGPRKVVEKKGQLVFYRQHESGGHFAAMERPKEFAVDMEDFMQIVLKKVGL
ncbi:Epoxide hydrolase [Colletotrichum higginsianum IMI 349063]|uniref:Epoxide hydrolase n=3 Tax=Colletotrichum higginsianum (strain IMI 349063) TaxID=759273 RepID=A0A1B7YEN8_COLHI|nr:Epoxide hydrolase [Colletotrichum higginsianum IMI 349063]OBR10499.1 Epoxide hydrolase [Colletotrichum higginsianum IMI 349063]